MLNEKLNWRYATKAMDPAKIVPRAKLDAILQAINLAPTSSGLQPFEVFVVTNAEIRAKIRDAAWNQAQITDSTYLLVFAAWDNYTAERIDAVVNQTHAERGTPMEMLNAYYDNLKASYLPRAAEVNYDHAARQAYIALGVGLVAAAFEEVDATPMEGFNPDAVDEILGLRAKGLRSVSLMPLGYRAAEGDWLNGAKKVRKPMSELVTEIA
ncbi:NAD(P)H-dependent oxidoreductase [Cypionkella sp.]|uniref:NAD(P)H-dependent oxidoreductase n=1 Tax=Cypionkella sp. TaxID=2811411 RepID=UPI00276A4731|nr:NAD(P)H-dependent oxidoreductase [Cypionkella sp.]